MKSLSARLFVAIALTNALAMLAVSALYGAGMERRREQIGFLVGDALAHHASIAADALAGGHRTRADAVLADLGARGGLVAALLDPRGEVVAGASEVPQGLEVIREVREAGGPTRLRFRDRSWSAVAIDGGLVAVAALEPRRSALGLSPPTLQLVLLSVLAAIVSLLLARWLGGSIRTLRGATERLAAGPSGVRVGPSISRTADAEVRALAQDFDRMAERIESLLESRERLLRDVSHELRSPLARLAVALELARETAGTDAQPALDRIAKEAERLEQLVAHVLAMAKLDDPSSVPDRAARVALHELLGEIHGDAAFEARSQGRDVVLARVDPVEVRGSEEILRQAVENVVRNAVRWTAEGTSVEVSLAEVRGETRGARLEVRDHGPGVPAAALEEIFRPFSRVEAARERTSGGAGLGLAITERAVRLHGGRVRAKNAEGGGLVVTIELPAA